MISSCIYIETLILFLEINYLMSQYLIDENGKKTHILLTIEEYEAFLEDFEDLKIAIARKNDEILSEKQALDYIMS